MRDPHMAQLDKLSIDFLNRLNSQLTHYAYFKKIKFAINIGHARPTTYLLACQAERRPLSRSSSQLTYFATFLK